MGKQDLIKRGFTTRAERRAYWAHKNRMALQLEPIHRRVSAVVRVARLCRIAKAEGRV